MKPLFLVQTMIATAAAFLLGLRAGMAIGKRNARREYEKRELLRRP